MKVTWFEGTEAQGRPPAYWTATAIQNGGRSILYQRSFANEARVSIAWEGNGTVVSTIIGDTHPAWVIGFTSLVIQEMNRGRWFTIRVIKNQFAYHVTCHFYRITLPRREPGEYRAFADFFKVGSAGARRERVGSWEKRVF